MERVMPATDSEARLGPSVTLQEIDEMLDLLRVSGRSAMLDETWAPETFSPGPWAHPSRDPSCKISDIAPLSIFAKCLWKELFQRYYSKKYAVTFA
jgi:hypothetical protein